MSMAQVAAATLDIVVSNSTDDAEENTNTSPGAMTLTSADLEMPWDGGKRQQMGMRFQNVTIPAGAAITKAYIQ
ncbi:MAG TPA: hypothetical protein VN448_08995, partial [Gammaproteobacteria bacterium]|nr:hypothetical protein [Gammaproteobacteria bacterium]